MREEGLIFEEVEKRHFIIRVNFLPRLKKRVSVEFECRHTIYTHIFWLC